MAEISVTRMDDRTFEVTVRAATTTTHTVSLSRDDYERLTSGRVPAETLIEKSFEFLLEREPNTMILSRFELPIISRYFPEYEEAISKRL